MISTLKKLQAKKAAQENSGGFTLIELLIVIVVLGILAAVVVFSLGGVTAQSAVAACQADGATVQTAMAAYNAQNTSGTPSSPVITSAGVVTTPSNLVPKYLASFPSSTHYVYAISTDTGSLWEAKGGISTTGLTTDASFTAVTPLLTWTKWIGSGTCTSTTTN
jgi:prepilin-type N-terminal cleavage/methylation domain-containing protein